MNPFFNKFRSQSKSASPMPPGLHQYQSAHDELVPYRLHLRFEKGGHALLIINASTILQLNPTAAEYAYHLVHQTPDDQIVEQITQRYRVSKQQAVDDMDDMRRWVSEIVYGKAAGVDGFYNFENQAAEPLDLSAPYRLDCALTDRRNDDAHNTTLDKEKAELGTDDWKLMLTKAWEVGIPHVIFAGGEPTLREDLADLIRHCEHNGQVTGLVTDGLRLNDTRFLSSLLQAGLDQLYILMQPDEQQVYDSITSLLYWSEALEKRIRVAVHITLSQHNVKRIRSMLDRLAESGINTLSLSVDDSLLNQELLDAREYADDLHLNLIWNLPVPYSKQNPVTLELDASGELPEGDQKGSLYVRFNGVVYREKNSKNSLGNLLSDPWDSIWSSA